MGNPLGLRQHRTLSTTRLHSAAQSRDPSVRRSAQYALNARKSADKNRTPKDHAKRLYGAKSNG